MQYTITLPRHDVSGDLLTPFVIEAMEGENGATSDHHPTDPEFITLTFANKKAHDAFVAKIANIEYPKLSEAEAPVTVEEPVVEASKEESAK